MHNSDGDPDLVIVPNSLRNPRIDTKIIDVDSLHFEVDTCGEGERLALCLHGFPEHSFSWRYQLPMLADLGFKAWAPNLRGYGLSSRPNGVSAYSLEDLLADVAGLIDVSGCKETVLIGHDWGAIIAWHFAMRRIRPLAKLIICNAPHPVAWRRAFKSISQLKRSWYVFLFQLPLLPEWWLGRNRADAVGEAIRRAAIDRSRFSDEVTEVYRHNAAQPGALTAMINYYRALVRGGGMWQWRSQRLGRIETPTLMVWGEEDHTLGKEMTRGTEAFVANLTIRFLPGTSHHVQQEQPDAVNAMMKAFLEGGTVPYGQPTVIRK